MLAALTDSKLKTWFYPNAVYVDKDIMQMATQIKEANEIGKLATITQFNGNNISVRRLDGSVAALGISPYPRMIYEQIDKKVDFEKAISMCRFVNDKALWACLAAMSIYFRELDTTEIALAAIDEADKVHFINRAMSLPSEPSKSAAIALYCKKYKEAE
jgi:intraflagellar transport protein 80